MLSFKSIHNEKKMKTILAKLKSLAKLSFSVHTIVRTVEDTSGDLFVQKMC